jgi:hypothetical protein
MFSAYARQGVVTLLALLSISALNVDAYDCGIDTVQLGIKNTPLDNGVPVNRGVQVKFPGNQILGLRLSTAWNNTLYAWRVAAQICGCPDQA